MGEIGIKTQKPNRFIITQVHEVQMMLGNMEECRDRMAGRGLEKIICLAIVCFKTDFSPISV